MNDKELVAQAALKFVKNNTIIGLGTGSTANYFIDGLAQKIKNESLDIKVVASSTTSQIKAIEAGLAYISLDQIETIDLYVDGADEVTDLDREKFALKGRGYDLIREKLLACTSDRFVIIGDQSKIVKSIGDNFPIPIEISPIAWRITKRLIEYKSFWSLVSCDLRKNTAGDGFAITSYGNLVLDCKIKSIEDINLYEISDEISNTPGVFEHGIFGGGRSDEEHVYTVLIANKGKVEVYGPGVYKDEEEAAIFDSFT
jgi:ribose 5-phosphate isomerase A